MSEHAPLTDFMVPALHAVGREVGVSEHIPQAGFELVDARVFVRGMVALEVSHRTQQLSSRSRARQQVQPAITRCMRE